MVRSPVERALGHRLDEGVVVPGLAQELLVVEEHARLGVLRNRVGAAVGALHRLPERGEDGAELVGIFGDVVVELQDEAILLEGADPFVRGDEHVRPLADAEHLEKLQGVVVEALGGALAHHHLDALVRTFGLERLVQPLGRLHHVAGPQRAGRILARPEFELDGLLRQHRRRGKHRRGRTADQDGQNRRSSALPVFHRALPCSATRSPAPSYVVAKLCNGIMKALRALVQPGMWADLDARKQ